MEERYVTEEITKDHLKVKADPDWVATLDARTRGRIALYVIGEVIRKDDLETWLKHLQNRLESAQDSGRDGYWSVAAFVSKNRLKLSRGEMSKAGRWLSRECRNRKVEIRKVSDPMFGWVNTYPEEMLEGYFIEREKPKPRRSA